MAQGVESDLQADAFAVLEQVGASHPKMPHWYLPAIGVEPIMQSKGYGSVLMDHGVAVCDKQHTAAYLESTNPANISLYRRFGFEIVGEYSPYAETFVDDSHVIIVTNQKLKAVAENPDD